MSWNFFDKECREDREEKENRKDKEVGEKISLSSL